MCSGCALQYEDVDSARNAIGIECRCAASGDNGATHSATAHVDELCEAVSCRYVLDGAYTVFNAHFYTAVGRNILYATCLVDLECLPFQ